jgi:hypothetical protein
MTEALSIVATAAAGWAAVATFAPSQFGHDRTRLLHRR